MIKVGIRNFQSIESLDLEINGLTIITGANNSGKTAVMRAIKGVFTNPPYGPLLRRGSDKLSVELSFSDGNVILWEKGPKDNSYTINGHKLSGVGRGAPPEVLEMGVHSVKAANEWVWPQIAPQFEGTLFLVNRPGSTLAESLSDVEKVGKLTDALRLSEKDKRSLSSELKVRRKDLGLHQEKVAAFEGFSNIEEISLSLEKSRNSLHETFALIKRRTALLPKLETSQEAVERLVGLDAGCVPDTAGVSGSQKVFREVFELEDRLSKARELSARFEGFASVSFPVPEVLETTRKKLQVASKLCDRFEKSLGEVRHFSGFSFRAPEFTFGDENWKKVSSWKTALLRKEGEIASLVVKSALVQERLEKAKEIIATVLKDKGYCPVCNTVCAKYPKEALC